MGYPLACWHPKRSDARRQRQRFVKFNNALAARRGAATAQRHAPCSTHCEVAVGRKLCPEPGQLCGCDTIAREQGNMKHAASRQLYAYWDERRGKRPAPERADIEPGAIRQALSDTFILALCDSVGGHPFRLAGTRVCALFGRELKGASFVDLWATASQPTVVELLAILVDECVGTVAGVTAHNVSGDPIDLELLLLPLGTRRPRLARAIGVLAPLKPPQWLGAKPIGGLTLSSHRHIGGETRARLLPRFMALRGRRNLVVYEGGRS